MGVPFSQIVEAAIVRPSALKERSEGSLVLCWIPNKMARRARRGVEAKLHDAEVVRCDLLSQYKPADLSVASLLQVPPQ